MKFFVLFFKGLTSSSWWTGPKKNPETKCSYTIYHFLRIKMVRKYGQKRDFAEFHSKFKHRVLNIYQNGLGRVERTLWTSSGCNMEVWRPKTKKPPALFLIPWFWAFFEWLFCKNEHLVNKRSTLISLTKIIIIKKASP